MASTCWSVQLIFKLKWKIDRYLCFYLCLTENQHPNLKVCYKGPSFHAYLKMPFKEEKSDACIKMNKLESTVPISCKSCDLQTTDLQTTGDQFPWRKMAGLEVPPISKLHPPSSSNSIFKSPEISQTRAGNPSRASLMV